MPHAVNKWMKADPEGYAYTAGGIVHNTLQNFGVHQTIASLKHFAQLGNMDEVKKAIAELEGAAVEIQQIASKAPVRKVDPREEQFKQREEEFTKQQTEFFQRELTAKVSNLVDGSVKSELGSYLKGQVISDNARSIMLAPIKNKLKQVLSANKGFVVQYNSLKSRNDVAGIGKLYEGILPKVMPGIVREIAGEFYKGQPKKQTTTPKQQQQTGTKQKPDQKAPAGWIQLAGKPKPEWFKANVDWSKTTDAMIWDNQAILKDGRKIKWAERT
jgi:hypothetical protein